MRKKLLAVVGVCLAVLLGSVVAYHYLSQHSSNPFTFSWTGAIAEKFGVETFWMNVTFERTNETHLTITAKVNDLSPGYLGIVFDKNHNGEIDEDDEGYVYRSTPYYMGGDFTTKHYGAQPAYLGPYRNGQRFFEDFAECYMDDLHTCKFDPELGYTYIIPVHFRNLPKGLHLSNCTEVELINDLIHVEYSYTVAVEFRFGMELIK